MVPNIAYIHPTLLLSLSDHLNRDATFTGGSTNTLIGLILGKLIKGKSVSLLYSFEIPESEYTDRQSFEKHLDLLSEVYGKGYLELVGFYVIGSDKDKNKQEVLRRQVTLLKKIRSASSSPENQPSLIKAIDTDGDLIFLQIDTPLVSDIESAVNIYPLNGHQINKIPFEVRFLGAEQLTIATYNNAPKIPTKLEKHNGSRDPGNVNLKSVVSGLDNLREQLKKALAFLDGVKNGTIKVDNDKEKYEALQALSDLAGRITAIKCQLRESRKASEGDSVDADELTRLIAVGSLCSSLFRKNMDYSI